MKAWSLLHLALAVVGFAAFSRRLGLAPESAAVAGLVFGLSGPSVSIVPFVSTPSSFALLPWVASFVLDARTASGRRPLVALALVSACLLLASAPEGVFHAALIAGAVLLSPLPEKEEPIRSRPRAAVVMAAAGALGAGLAAVSLLPSVAYSAGTLRLASGAMGERFGGLGSLPAARVPELLADGLVADWTRVARAPDVTAYPFLPSITPGRVAWLLVLAGLVASRRNRLAPALLAVSGVVLALGPASGLWGALCRVVPLVSKIRFPEKHLLLSAFGLAWLAALGIEAFVVRAERGRRQVFAVLALVALGILVDRESIARRLSPVGEATLLSRPPAVLAEVPATASLSGPAPRLFSIVAHTGWGSDPDDLESDARTNPESAFPEYQGLFGLASSFPPDYDMTLPVRIWEWSELVSDGLSAKSPFPLRAARAVGAIGAVDVLRGPANAVSFRLSRFRDPVEPYRFAARLVRDDDDRRLVARLLSEGFDPKTAYVLDAAPSAATDLSEGRVLSLSDRPSGLTLRVHVEGPAPGFLMVYRPREAAEEAFIDGKKARLLDVAHGFAGVFVGPGDHDVRLQPNTRWLIIGALMSAASLVLLGAIALLPRRRKQSA